MDIAKYYIINLLYLKDTKQCPLCFNLIKTNYSSCGDHFRLPHYQSDCRLSIKDKYFINFIITHNNIKLEVRNDADKSVSKPLVCSLYSLVDKVYEFKELIKIINPKLDKLITFQ